MPVADKIRKKLGALPHKPGIYLMRDRFGTVIYVGRARDLRKRVNQYCRPLTPNERDYRHCLYAHLKYCTAPCIGNVTRGQYLEQVRAACEFLEGQCAEMQEQLAGEMKKAAAAQEYERAAELRDLLSNLRHTTAKINRFERVPYSLPLAI